MCARHVCVLGMCQSAAICTRSNVAFNDIKLSVIALGLYVCISTFQHNTEHGRD